MRSRVVKRRDFLKLGSVAVLGSTPAAQLAAQMPMPSPAAPAGSPQEPAGKADFTLQIAPVALELAPNLVVSTTGYNGNSPGPLLRFREGKPVSVDVIN